MMSGGREVDVGGGTQLPKERTTIRSSALPRFWTPDLSVMETTRLER